MPVTIPAGVEVTIAEGNVVTVKGPKGTLTQNLHPEMILEQEGNVINVKRPSDDKAHCALHGMTRALLHNMVVGVSEGFKKELEINGVGYRATKEGKNLVMNLGYSHQVIRDRRHHHRCSLSELDRDLRSRQAEGGPVRGGSPREASPRALQGQGYQVCR
jgi:ribosomal protein L6P/L9E